MLPYLVVSHLRLGRHHLSFLPPVWALSKAWWLEAAKLGAEAGCVLLAGRSVRAPLLAVGRRHSGDAPHQVSSCPHQVSSCPRNSAPTAASRAPRNAAGAPLNVVLLLQVAVYEDAGERGGAGSRSTGMTQ